jgi:hypothetical protein
MGQGESQLSIIVLGFIFHYLVSWVVRSIIIIIETPLMSSLLDTPTTLRGGMNQCTTLFQTSLHKTP